MQRIQSSPQQEGLAFEDTSELFTACNALQSYEDGLFSEVHGALGEVLELQDGFKQVQIFGEDAVVVLSALSKLAQHGAQPGWQLAAHQMMNEYQDPMARQAKDVEVSASEQQLVRAGARPYHEKLIGTQVVERLKHKPNADFSTVFQKLAQLELDDPRAADAGPTSYDGSEEAQSHMPMHHSDRVLVLV